MADAINLGCKKFLEKLRKNKNILAIGIEGSFAAGYSDEFSDIDVLLIVENNFCTKELIEFCLRGKLNLHPHQEIFENLNMVAAKIDNVRMDLKLVPVKNLKKIKLVYFKKFSDPRRLFDIDKGTNLDDDIYKSIVYLIRIRKHFEINKRRNNPLFMFDLIHSSMKILMKVVYKLNDRKYDSMKWAMRDLESFDIKPKMLEKRILKILKSRSDKAKVNEIHDLGNEVFSMIPDKIEKDKIRKHIEWMDGEEVLKK